jgi:hypothetical protein
VIEMTGLEGPLVVFGLLIVLLLVRIPVTWHLLVGLARRVSDWATIHWTRAEDGDRYDAELWQMERRRRLCADLRRVEHLLATDTWMSATRQLGNRIAYDRLVDDLRHTPDVVSTILQPQIFGPWDEAPFESRALRLIDDGSSRKPPTVEILEIGWGRRRH